jgi:hypothetical protein
VATSPDSCYCHRQLNCRSDRRGRHRPSSNTAMLSDLFISKAGRARSTRWCVFGAAARRCCDPVHELGAQTATSWLARHRWRAMTHSKLFQQVKTAVNLRSQDSQRSCLPSSERGRQSHRGEHVQSNGSASMLTEDLDAPGRGILPGRCKLANLWAHTRQALVVHLAGSTGGAPAM